MILAAMFWGCQQSKPTDAENLSEDFPVLDEEDRHSPFKGTTGGLEYDLHYSDSAVEILDSLMSYLYVDVDSQKKAAYEWRWAKRAKGALGKSSEETDLEVLEAISRGVDDAYEPLLAYSQHDINTATSALAASARFRLLSAYQTLDTLMSDTSLPKGSCQKDYALWENVFREFEDRYTDAGSSGPMVLNTTYVTLADLRYRVLKEEIGYVSSTGKKAEWYVNADEIQWDSTRQAIRQWYDFRMKIAGLLEKDSKNRAAYYRRMTYKTAFIYQHLQLDWMYDFEKEN